MIPAMLGECCTTGHMHQGTPTGQLKSVNGVQVYYAVPASKSTTHVVVIFSDAMGHTFVNSQLIADNFAANGFFTIMPDLFRGDAVPLNRSRNFDTMQWLKNHLPIHVEPIIRDVMNEVKAQVKWKTVAGVGYCFGAKYVLRFLRLGQLDAGYIAHPTQIDQQDIIGVQNPLSVAAAAHDNTFTSEKRHEMEDLLMKTKVPYQITLYSDVQHGFAVRGNDKDPRCKFAKEQAFVQAVQWFKHHLAPHGPPPALAPPRMHSQKVPENNAI